MTTTAPDVQLDVDLDAAVPCVLRPDGVTECDRPAVWLLRARHHTGDLCHTRPACDYHRVYYATLEAHASSLTCDHTARIHFEWLPL